LAARLGYGEGTFPPGRRKDDDQRDARAALLAAEAEAARLLRSGRAPVAVSPDTGDPHESDDLLVVSAPVDGLEGALEGTAEASPHARLLVVTGDPEGSPSGAATGGDRTGDGTGDGVGPGSGGGEAERRQRRLERAATTVAEAHADGIPVVGAFHQPAVDGYEWHRGFDARLGLFDRDRNPRPALDALPRPRPGS
jgi:hypothetical protein